MSESEIIHRREVSQAIERAFAQGLQTYDEILATLGGADPSLVRNLYDELKARQKPSATSLNLKANALEARRLTASLPLSLPAPNPMISQWWFTLNTVVQLSERVWSLSRGQHAAFLGTPTVGYHYARCYSQNTSVLDVDPDIVHYLELPEIASKVLYDVNDELPQSLKAKHGIVLIDPPWYPHMVELFVARSRQLIGNDGFLLTVLPSRLTRPGLIQERTDLINKLLSNNFEVVSLESDYVQYAVPDFELHAYRSVPEFSGRWWRRGDLLILRVNPKSSIEIPKYSKETVETFARDYRKRRFFLIARRQKQSLSSLLEEVDNFDRSVSTRQFSSDEIAIWGSNRKGARLKDADIARQVLIAWASGQTEAQAIKTLSLSGQQDAASIVTLFDDCLEIWREKETLFRRRSPAQLETLRKNFLCELAAQPSGRKYDYQPDDFRIDFQRDRDRVLWSHFLERLASKTQLFPVNSDDQLRRRLAHSIEVMQLASTIAMAFGLDRDLTEAGALAHDIGHTPFGHAGEYALDKTINGIDLRLGGFNHYEHGVDVVRWVEDMYQSPGAGGFPGLNLTFETVECIFKHTYYRGDEEPFGQRLLSKRTKHEDLRADCSCHLEGQAVRIADKISYLISDLEDGIRMEIIKLDDLYRCRFFERPPIDLVPSPGESLYDRFISQRRSILKVIMEDILSATDKRLGTISSVAEIRAKDSYIVTYSEEIDSEITQIWEYLQAGILHNNPAVMAKNTWAARIISDLFLLFAVAPHLVDARFKNSHSQIRNTEYMKWYVDKVGDEVGIRKKQLVQFAYEHTIGNPLRPQGDNWMIPTENIILAKDYVASLSDTRATAEYRKHISNLTE